MAEDLDTKKTRGKPKLVPRFAAGTSNKTRTETVYNSFNKQPKFTALQGTIHNFTYLKQDFKKKESLN